MLIYILCIIFSCFFVFIAEKYHQQLVENQSKRIKFKYHLFAFLAFLIPFLIMALRSYSVGTDTSGTYYQIYQKSLYGSSGIRDIGYYFINRIGKLLFGNYRGVLIITSCIICFIAYKMIFNESKNPLFSTYLFFVTNVYFISMNMIRQSIATMIFVISIKYIREKKFIKYLICILIATSIHAIATLYLPLYLINIKKYDLKKIIILIIILSIFSHQLSPFIINILNSSNYFRQYFSSYFTSAYNVGQVNFYSLIISIFILILIILGYKKGKNNFNFKIMSTMSALSFLFLSYSKYIPLSQRLSFLMSYPLFIYLPEMVNFVDSRLLKFLNKYGILIGYTIYMIMTVFVMHYHAVVPYKSMFS